MNKPILATITAAIVGTSGILAAAQSIRDARTPEDVVNLLDSLIQPRFQRFDDGVFGVDRIPVFMGHDTVKNGRPTEEEKKIIAAVDAANRPYAVAFLGCGKPTATKFHNRNGSTQPMPQGASYNRGAREQLPRVVRFHDASAANRGDEVHRQTELQKELEKLDPALIEKAKSGKARDAALGNWLVALRPVKAAKRECLSCHTNAKEGQTLGVLFYAAKKQTVQPQG